MSEFRIPNWSTGFEIALDTVLIGLTYSSTNQYNGCSLTNDLVYRQCSMRTESKFTLILVWHLVEKQKQLAETKLPFFISDNLHSRIKVQIKFYGMGIVLATRINRGRSVPPNENTSNPSKGALGCLWRDNLNSVILEHLNTNSICVNSNSLMKVWAVILMLLWFQTPKQTKYFQQGSFTLTTLQFLSTRSKS